LLHSGEVLPIGLFIAPLNKEFGATALPPLEPRPQEPVSPGEICLAGQQGFLLLWIDRARPEMVRRFRVRKSNGVAWIEGEIEWSEGATIGPAPARWLVTTFDDDGNVRQVHDGRVTRCEFNAPIAESEWRITYPAGARFHDMIAQKEYVVDDDGELRPAGMAQASAGQRGKGWLGYSMLAAAVLAAAAWWRSWRTASRSPF
jgi:hypothetical protein